MRWFLLVVSFVLGVPVQLVEAAGPQESLPSLSPSVCMIGYFGAATSNAGRPEYIGETSDAGNVVFLDFDGAENARRKLVLAKRHGLRVIVTRIRDVFYRRGTELNLRDDYQARWARFSALVSAHRQEIIAFYPFDEPIWNAEGNRTCPQEEACRGETLDVERVYRRIEFVNQQLKDRYPDIPIMMIEAYPVVFASSSRYIANLNAGGKVHHWRVPRGVDWIGADCYGDFNSCGQPLTKLRDGTLVRNGSLKDLYDVVRSRLRAGQLMVLVPDARLVVSAHSRGLSKAAQTKLIRNIEKSVEMTHEHKLTIGVFPFLYGGFARSDGAVVIGARDMPALKLYVAKLATVVKNNKSCRLPAPTW